MSEHTVVRPPGTEWTRATAGTDEARRYDLAAFSMCRGQIHARSVSMRAAQDKPLPGDPRAKSHLHRKNAAGTGLNRPMYCPNE
jgi:hypothetical protein